MLVEGPHDRPRAQPCSFMSLACTGAGGPFAGDLLDGKRKRMPWMTVELVKLYFKYRIVIKAHEVVFFTHTKEYF